MSEEEVSIDWHWRNSMKVVRFFKFDARCVFLWVAVLIHAAYWTLFSAVGITIIFALLERKGLSLPAALRAFRVWIIGPRRPALNWTARRKFFDGGSS